MALKRSPLRRKTSLKSNSSLKRSDFKQKSCAPLKQKTQLNRVSKKKQDKANGYIYNTLSTKSTGLTGRGRSAEDVVFHSRVASLGCIACRKLGLSTVFPLRIHHIDGRYQGGENDFSERKVLPLCDQHHHPSLAFEANGQKPDLEAPSVHDRKRLFVDLVGTEEQLLLEVYQALEESPPWLDINAA